MPVVTTLTELGGVATFRELARVHTRSQIRAAVSAAEVDLLARGRYALPAVAEHRAAAHRHTAAQSHVSAAQAYGWKVKFPPGQPWLTFPLGRQVQATDIHVRRAELTPQERAAGRTSPLRTVLDCARDLPYDEGLAVADSALRAGAVDPDRLRSTAATLRGPGTAQARRIAGDADGRAANPFESVLRAIALEIPELAMRPQALLTDDGLFAQVDLADEVLRLVLEADSYEHHGTQRGFTKDRRRYTELTAFGYHVLSFVWVDVMHHPAWVRWCIECWLATQLGRPKPPRPDRVPSARDLDGA
ncbi:DUF559 domain-containing protein [Nostocoides australiense]|uniref:DUF559 domain-containing protein n=1 Tax=Nostocoides australiense Ben110 TaxID=1193182 RepID=W6JV63_9MICO|nr:DUF559 domain-containing protein [Tetrasphaera australiensis]MCA0292000.1 endonuclease domain-containing protein [Actinomycetota bacterium]MCB1301410.1 DUF559 domain-containing protein [Tetrasphaera sp.]CCH72516.1 conserved hypothetical protein [Tetrasphaera australiensis Ben110]HPF82206.1 DUF559 domain-containing protein [Tetrasphaera australiensis]HRW01371.1 DUF559 domain-containing protein [Tetrasphaera sp.]